jgi:hypothetical protein
VLYGAATGIGERLGAHGRTLLAVGVVFLGTLGLGGANALANTPLTYTVSGTADAAVAACSGSVCPTLRDAVSAADANAGSTIQLAGANYTLSVSAGALTISANTTIDGLGPTQTTITQTHAGDGVFVVEVGVNVAITGVTITGGSAVGSTGISGNVNGGDGQGGAIDSGGMLTLTDDALDGDHAVGGSGYSTTGLGGWGQGGGVYSYNGALTIVDSSFADDTAINGGVQNPSSTQNSGFADGGAIFAGSGTVTIENSTIGPDDTATETTTEPGGVTSAPQGGGVAVYVPTTIVNSTIFDDSATDGGGLLLTVATTLASDTFDANVGDNIAEGGGPATLKDTIIANGVGGNYCFGSEWVDDGHNFETDAVSQCGLGGAGKADLLFSQGHLASGLSSNGGSTQTIALLPGAPEIGAGGSCTNPLSTPANQALAVDQRGLPRPLTCDIGAFQTEVPVNTGAPTVSGVAQIGQSLLCNTGAWTGDGALGASGGVGALAYSYAWLRNGAAIGGASAQTYGPQIADVGAQLSCEVSAAGAYGQSGAVVSAAVAVPVAGIEAIGTVKIKSPKILVTLTCGGGAGQTCGGALKLVTVEHLSGKKITAVSAKSKKKPKKTTKTVTLGSVTYSVADGASDTVTLTLSKAGQQLLKKHHKLPAELELTAAGGVSASATKNITITPSKAKKEKKKHH